MPVEVMKDRNTGKVGEVVLGATKEEGGTRSHSIVVGGDTALPFHHFEGQVAHRPVVALEVQDVVPAWPAHLAKYYQDVWNDPAAWAKKCVDEYGADLVYVKLDGADPEGANHSAADCTAIVKDILAAVGVPLVVAGCGQAERDNEVLEAVASAAAGEKLLLGNAEQDNYRTLTAACLGNGHSIIAKSPLDINICKQLNILITEMNMPLDRIVIDPSIGGLGYGIEYAYSIMERSRLGALQGDKMLSMPILCTVGYECWRAKEMNSPEEENPEWGSLETRGIMWEATAANALLQAGAHILLMRHPEAAALVKKTIDKLMQPNNY